MRNDYWMGMLVISRVWLLILKKKWYESRFFDDEFKLHLIKSSQLCSKFLWSKIVCRQFVFPLSLKFKCENDNKINIIFANSKTRSIKIQAEESFEIMNIFLNNLITLTYTLTSELPMIMDTTYRNLRTIIFSTQVSWNIHP